MPSSSTGQEPIVIPSSIYVIWSGGDSYSSLQPNLNVYFSSTGTHAIENLRSDSLDGTVAYNKKMDIATVDLQNTGVNQIIGAWEANDSVISLNLFSPNHNTGIPLNGRLVAGNGEQRRIYVIPGDFDGDGDDEFLVAFINEDKKIDIRLFDSNGTLEPKEVAQTEDEDLSGNPSNKLRFTAFAGDFDGNGDDEIALLSYDADADPTYEKGVYVKIYDIQGNSFVPKVKQIIMPETTITGSQYTLNSIVLSGSSVPGYGASPDMMAIAFTHLHDESPNHPDTYLLLVRSSQDLGSLTYDENKEISKHYNSNFVPNIAVLSGDFDDDGSAELVFIRSGFFDIYRTDADLNLERMTGGGFSVSNNGDDLQETYNFAKVTNLDDQPGDELLVVKNIWTNDDEHPFPQHFEMSVFGDTTETLDGFGLKSKSVDLTDIPKDWPTRSYAITAGDFGKSKVTIKAPKYSHRSDISQPIVVLNAPPVHFDEFADEIYDINTCYNGGDCNFLSTYTKITSQSSELTTDIQSSWDVSAGLAREGSIGAGVEVEAAPLGVGGSVSATYSENFEYHLLGTYGSHFENSNTNKQTQTIQLQVSAIEDDQIFANITDYDVWEYPYFIGDNQDEAGVIVAVRPTHSEARWFPSKSVSGYSFQPLHEVGNILSYYSYDSIHTNPQVFQEIQPENDISTPTFTLSANSDYHWELTETNFEQSQASRSIQFGIDAGAMGFGYKFQFNQSNSYLYTQSTSIANELKLTVDIGGINRSIGPTEYRITPYAYWSKEGALVIDYSVEPEVDLQGGSTWWQEKYGSHSDPTMILPWRLDPEKGFAISDESKRTETKDIKMNPLIPAEGDTAVVTANVRNFSLKDTPSKVKVQFYLGDPSLDGELVHDIYGNTEFLTDGPVPSRGVKTIRFIWVKPLGLTHSRLYMVLDPDQEISEIHENNNTGWIPLSEGSNQTDVRQPVAGPDGPKLYQNYPNPFSTSTTVDYYLEKTDRVILRIYDVAGNLVSDYNEGMKNPGMHSIVIDGENLSPGVYYYTLVERSQGSRSMMMVVIH